MNAKPLTVFAWPSANTAKVLAVLFETGLEHEIEWVDVDAGEHRAASYRAKVPLAQVPAIVDRAGPGGRPLALTESGAIALYLAEKAGCLLPAEPAGRYEALQWVIWQAASQGPVFGRLQWLLRGPGKDMSDRRVHDDFIAKGREILEKLDERLAARDYILGADYSVADIALWPWLRVLRNTTKAGEDLRLGDRTHVLAWFERCTERPASQRALQAMRDFMATRQGS